MHARAASRRARRTAVRTRADDGGASTPRAAASLTRHTTASRLSPSYIAGAPRSLTVNASTAREARATRRGRLRGRGWRGRLRVVDDRRGSTRRRSSRARRIQSRRDTRREDPGSGRGLAGRGGGGGAEERVDGSVGDEDGVGRGLDGVRAVGSRGAADGGVGVGDDAPAFRDGTGLVEGEDRVASLGVEDERPGGSGGLASRVAEMAVEGDGYPRQPFVRGRFARRAAARARLRTPIRRPDHLRRVRSATGHALRANTCQTRAIADCPPPGVSPSGKLGSSEETLIARDHHARSSEFRAFLFREAR